MAFHILGHLDLRVGHHGEERLQTSMDMLQDTGLRETGRRCSNGISVIAQTLTAGGWTDGLWYKVRQENCAGMKTVTHSHSPGRTNLTNKAKLGHSQEELASLYLQTVNKITLLKDTRKGIIRSQAWRCQPHSQGFSMNC